MSDIGSSGAGASEADPVKGRQDLGKALASTLVGVDLLHLMAEAEPLRAAGAFIADVRAEEPPQPVVIEANGRFAGGAAAARLLLARSYVTVRRLADDPAVGRLRARGVDLTFPLEGNPAPFSIADTLDLDNSFWTDHHLIGVLSPRTIYALAAWGRGFPQTQASPIYKIWRNHPVQPSVYESVRTVKCDAAQTVFRATGEDIIWAVADTGVDGTHPHFDTHDTLDPTNGLDHHDFTQPDQTTVGSLHPALVDHDGHGTHVAGIIAGESYGTDKGRLVVCRTVMTSPTTTQTEIDVTHKVIAGLAPKAKLLSLKVLSNAKQADVGLLLAAIGYIQAANANGADVKIHGLNLSLGYAFDPRWFAAGQSPLCAEVNRLVKSGVVVVAAAGNAGYGTVQNLDLSTDTAAHLGTIEDPGNAELAITVGSTHRDMPYTYGVSYFSAKGPTADGRQKPDLVAPGERIVSCARMDGLPGALARLDDPRPKLGDAPFRELSGTSMAAPHVSGVIAAFLSVRREFRGQPEEVKSIFMKTAKDLGRRPEFQGEGLIDAMQALLYR